MHPSRVIDSHEIIFVLKGQIHLRVEEDAHTLEENDVAYIKPGRWHGGAGTSLPPTSFYWFHFQLSDAAWLNTLPTVFRAPDGMKINMLLHQMLDIANSAPYPKWAADLITGLVLSEIVLQSGSLKGQHSRLTSEIAEWIRINSDKKITLGSISEKFGYNADYLARLFKRSFNVGIKEYIYGERIKACENLLISSYYSIKQIANILGFENENRFVKFFKYHKSVSPGRYRDLYINTHLNKR